MKRVVLLILLLVVSVEARVYCSNFDTQAEAQAYYDAQKWGYKSLDGDKDGEACECLYGGSHYDKSYCEKWRDKYNKR